MMANELFSCMLVRELVANLSHAISQAVGLTRRPKKGNERLGESSEQLILFLKERMSWHRYFRRASKAGKVST